MIDDFNEADVRKFRSNCRCKICDEYKDEGVYLKSFRLSAQPFHICLDCWDEINKMVEKYKSESNKK